MTESYGLIEKLMRWGTRIKRESESGWSIHWFRGPHIVWSNSWIMFRLEGLGYGFSLYKAYEGWKFIWLTPSAN